MNSFGDGCTKSPVAFSRTSEIRTARKHKRKKWIEFFKSFTYVTSKHVLNPMALKIGRCESRCILFEETGDLLFCLMCYSTLAVEVFFGCCHER